MHMRIPSIAEPDSRKLPALYTCMFGQQKIIIWEIVEQIL